VVQTPAPNSGWTQSDPAPTKVNNDDWDTPSPAPTPAAKNDNGWGDPSGSDSPAAAPARAGPGIHPSRLAMLGGKGAAAEYTSPLHRDSAPREVPPHMRTDNGGSNGHGYVNANGIGNGGFERTAEPPRAVGPI